MIILDKDFHDLLDRRRMPEPKPVTIGDRVWIGNRVIVLPRVSIGDDAAVGAGAVVTSDVPPRSVVAGNPARVVRQTEPRRSPCPYPTDRDKRPFVVELLHGGPVGSP